MKLKIERSWALGALVAMLGALWAGPVVARGVGLIFGDNLIVSESRSVSPDVTVGKDDAYIKGTLEVDGAARFDGALDLNAALAIDNALTLSDSASLFTVQSSTWLINSGFGAKISTDSGGSSAYLYLDPINASFTVNEDAIDRNFRVKGNGHQAGLYYDAGTDEVGIGTAVPEGQLHIQSQTGGGTLINFGTTDVVEDMKIGIENDESGFIKMLSNVSFNLQTNSLTRFTVAAGGSIGVGTTSPNAEFHVFASSPVFKLESGAASTGGCITMEDNDGGGFSNITVLNGAIVLGSGECL